MASSASATISLLSSCGTPLVDGRAARRHAHCLPLSVNLNGDSSLKMISMPLGRRIAGSGISMATGETQYVDTSETLVSTSKAPDAPPESTIVAPSAEVPLAISEASATLEAPAEFASEVPEIVKTLQTAWDKVDDKYAVIALAIAGIVALWGSAGLISAIDKLPLVPGILELVGIGYSGWFAYQYLVFKPEREALFKKVKGTYNEIIGDSAAN